jgi:hypothetical protein
MCRRASERTPLRGRHQCAAGGRPNTIECGPGLTLRSILETKMLGVRAIGGGGRALDGVPDGYPGISVEKSVKRRGKHTCAVARALAFHYVCLSWSPSLALEVTGDLDKEDRRAVSNGYDLGAGFTRCDGGVDKRLHEEGFRQLSPSYLRRDRSHVGARLGWSVVPLECRAA